MAHTSTRPRLARRPPARGGRLRGLGLVLCAMLPGACALRPYVADAVDPTQVPREFDAASLDDPVLLDALQRLAPAGAPGDWTPARLGLFATLRSRAVREAQASLAAARAARAAALQRANPKLFFGLERHSLIDDNQTGNWSLGPSFELTLAPRGRRALLAARADIDVRRASLALVAAAWTTRTAATAAALALLASREQAVHDATTATARDAAVTAARAAVAAGVMDPSEWQTLLLEANGARLARLARVLATSQAEASLATALGLPLPALEDLALSPPSDAPMPPYDALQRHMLMHDPTVLDALLDFDTADRDLALAVHAQYPSVELSPGYFFDQGDHVWSLLGGVVVPVFARLDIAVAGAEAARAAARERAYATQSAAIAGLREAYAHWSSCEALQRGTREVATDIRTVHATFLRQAEAGLVDQLAVKRAAQQLAEVEAALAASAAAVRSARHMLETAARLPIDDPAFVRYLDELQAADAAPTEP